MLRLLTLACLLAASAAQSYFYCDSSPSIIRLSDFYLVTRRALEPSYPPGLTCDFNAQSDTSVAFFIEIQSFRVGSAVLTISSGGRVLFSGNSLQNYQSSISTTSSQLQIRFNAIGDYSYGLGVVIRVRAITYDGCPPGWTSLNGNCFGTSTTSGRLTFSDSQRACNSMRANLLHLPSNYVGTVGSFMRMLPVGLRNSYTWIGLTDKTRVGQYYHYWLNGNRQYTTSEISCQSGGSYLSCIPTERCGAMNDKNTFYSVYMSNCYGLFNFSCSMPTGGTNYFYTVPDDTNIIITGYSAVSSWVWVGIAIFVFAVLAVSGAYGGVRYYTVYRTPSGATGVVVTTGSVTIPPPTRTVVYPMQPPHPHYPSGPQYPSGPHYPTGSIVPPPYEATVGGGYGNQGYGK